MDRFESISIYVSKLSLEQIKNLSDKEILALRIERPNHKGQYGFMLNQKYFKSDQHHNEIMYALATRLSKVKPLTIM